jgi:hypothetical protein
MDPVSRARAVLYYEHLAPSMMPIGWSSVLRGSLLLAPVLICSWHALRGGPVSHAASHRVRVSQCTTQG